MMKWIDGAKTSLGMIAAGVVGVLTFMGVLDLDTKVFLWTLIGSWTGFSLRSAYKKGK